MDVKDQHLDALNDIRKMMQRSSRFISLSGLSGIAAGIWALIGAYFAYDWILNTIITMLMKDIPEEILQGLEPIFFYWHQLLQVWR
jgi:hypothetical protein